MAYNTNWYPGYEGRVVLQKYEGQLTIEEIIESNNTTLQLMHAGSAPVHVVADIRSVKQFPTRVGQLRQAANYLADPTFGWLTLVGGTTLMTSFAMLVTQVTRTRLRTFGSPDEALSFLSREDKTLAKTS
jgi:hypothetical protein